jgi:hypothetical protein
MFELSDIILILVSLVVLVLLGIERHINTKSNKRMKYVKRK